MTTRRTDCPVCGAETHRALARARLPVMQNVVLASREEAVRAQCAPFELRVCGCCGLAYNAQFQSHLIQYDERYDNDVPSAAFMQYYREIAEMLDGRFQLSGRTVYDVGCGKGTFLRVLADVATNMRGYGVDPSCTPMDDGRVALVNALFTPELVSTEPSLLICRHVLEHIDQPVAFAGLLRNGLQRFPRTPVYLEVPELDWILRSGAFWDFCYEHCNYFTAQSLRSTASRAGLSPIEGDSSFGGQYQWLVCRAGGVTEDRGDGAAVLERVQRYAEWESERIGRVKQQIEGAASDGPCVLWGMATKGVVFANIVDPEATLIVGGVDVNAKKQSRFVPGTGHEIHSPSWLQEFASKPITIVVMNPNYRDEIAAQVKAMGVVAQLITI